MGHDDHFLSRLDRVSWVDAELALTLYRDHELVRELIESSSLPQDTERIAISLDDPEAGPFVIVARDGHFVTCLGEGMRAKWPVLTRAELDYISKDLTGIRTATSTLQCDAERRDVVQDLFSRGELLFSEDIAVLAAVQPAICSEVIRGYLTLTIELNKMLPDLKRLARRQRRSRERFVSDVYRLMWCVRNLALVAGLDSPRTTCKLLARKRGTISGVAIGLEQSFVGWAVMWWVAQTGLELLPRYLTRVLAGAEPRVHADAVAAVVALASRHPECRAEVRESLLLVDDGGPASFHTITARTAAKALDLIDSGQHNALADELIREQGFGYRALIAPDVTRADDIPVDLALPWALATTYNIFASAAAFTHFLTLLARIAPLSAERLCPPRELGRHHAARIPGAGLLLSNLRDAARFRSAGEVPSTTKKSPPRNGRCPCGSGKKYKQCCARAHTVR
jgi:hypothetical protein